MDIQAYIQSGIIESYVLGLTSAAESAEVETLSLQHPAIQQAIDEFSVALEKQAIDNAVAPPPGVKQRIMDAIREEDEQKISPIGSTVNTEKSQTKNLSQESDFSAPVVSIDNGRVRLWKYLAAASIILFIASASYSFYLNNQYNYTSKQYQALLLEKNSLQANNNIYQAQLKEWHTAAGMMADPEIAMIKMPSANAKQDNMATIFWDTRTKDVFVMANKLPSLVANKQYQLWAIVDGKPVDAGMLDPNCSSVCKMKNIPKAQAFAITLENFGGSPTPTMEQLMVMGKV